MGIGGRVVGEESVLIHKVACEQVFPILLPETHVSGRVSWSMQHLDDPASKIDSISIAENSGWSPLEKLVGVHIVTLRQITAVDNHLLDLFQGERKFTVEPVQFVRMGIELREITVPSDMVPVNMRCDCDDRFACQLHNLFMDIAYTQSGIDKQAVL
ncbi:hypothetical protein SDC9_145259 [bioreactor metagenome]|uniref:Uncharacterized protein n=1 Tax=bioreactor metagenome TaxID=1076179 RepID=A0A645EAB9_9ZZZZ